MNSNMPKVSYMKAIDYFLLTSFGFIFAALVEYIIVLNTDGEFGTFAAFMKRILSRFKIGSSITEVEQEMELEEFEEVISYWNYFCLHVCVID